MKKLFLDTNIVIDLLDKREPFCYDAVNLFTLAYNKKVQLPGNTNMIQSIILLNK